MRTNVRLSPISQPPGVEICLAGEYVEENRTWRTRIHAAFIVIMALSMNLVSVRPAAVMARPVVASRASFTVVRAAVSG